MAEIESGELALSSTEVQSSNRWIHEQIKLRNFSGFNFVSSGGSIVAAEGELDTQYGNTYHIRIELKEYPYKLPSIRLKNYDIHPDAPHRYTNGSICVMRSSQWRKNFTVALLVAKTAIWLCKYELWKRNGHRWPGLGQSHWL